MPRPKRFVVLLIPVLVLALLGVVIASKIIAKRNGDAAQVSQRAKRGGAAASVSVVKAEFQEIAGVFEATGTLETSEDVKVAPKVAGRLASCRLQEGARVKKGDTLAVIESSDVQAEVSRAEAAVDEALAKLAQSRVNERSGQQSAKSQVAQQEAAVSSAAADLNQAKHNAESQIAAAEAAIADANSRITSAQAAKDNADAAVQSAEANRENARTKYNRIKGLFDQKFVSAQEVDDAKAALAVQEAAVVAANGQKRTAEASQQSAEKQLASATQQQETARAKGEADRLVAQAKLDQALAALDAARENRVAQTPAYDQGIRALQASVASAQAALASARAKQADLTLKSPLDGVVTARYLDPGSIVSVGQAILAVQFMSQVLVSIAVPEDVFTKAHVGQEVKVIFDAPIGERTATIVQMNPAADAQSRLYTVRASLNNSDDKSLKPGMFARVQVQTDSARMIAVPPEAVKKEGSDSVVFVVTTETGEDGKPASKAERRVVKTGSSNASYIGILEGLSEGDSVVTVSTSPLRDGQAVTTGGGRGGRGGQGGQGGEAGAPGGDQGGAPAGGRRGGGRPGGQGGAPGQQ